jgi:N-acetylmuramoyl-L-alanine amidase
VSLSERVEIANAAKADVFISLHVNASPTQTQEGFETYVLDAQASSLEAARTARRENGGSAEDPSGTPDRPEAAKMVRELELTAHRASAVRLAQRIQRQQKERFPTRIDRGVKQAPFDVLMGARMPALLFEAGFLDHPTEGVLLRESRGPIVTGLAVALLDHYRERSRLL